MHVFSYNAQNQPMVLIPSLWEEKQAQCNEVTSSVTKLIRVEPTVEARSAWL